MFLAKKKKILFSIEIFCLISVCNSQMELHVALVETAVSIVNSTTGVLNQQLILFACKKTFKKIKVQPIL